MSDFLDSLKRKAEDKERAIKKEPLVPAYVAQAKDESGIDARVIAYHNPKSSIAENYRAIFTHLKTSLGDNDIKNIAITSASGDEGKSITAVNLSIIMANDFGKRVLLIDANLRKPVVDELMNVKAEAGLSEILSKDRNYKEALTSTKINNLRVITAGTNIVNPVELLSNKRMSQILKEARQEFDYVILDTPAVVSYADTKIIAPLVDGVVLTVKARKTRREVITRAYSLLEQTGTKNLGFILTDIEYYIPEFIYRYL